MKTIFSKTNLRIHFSLFLLIGLILFSFGQSTKPQPTTKKKNPVLILESADINENTFSNGELVSVLRGNVVFSYDDLKIRSGEATWWKNKGVISFREGVKAERGKEILTCNRMHFTKDGNLLTASGNFHYNNPEEKSHLYGNEAEYYLGKKHFLLKGDPKFVQYDSAAAETLTITGITMSYTDSLKKAVVNENVTISKGKLLSKCKRADYFTKINSASLRIEPKVYYEAHTITGDSIDLAFGKKSLKSATVVGKGHGVYVDTTDPDADSTFTHIWGDSLYLSVSDSGNLDTLWSFGKASSKYFTSKNPLDVDEASGKVMVLAFDGKSNVKNVRIWGNARSTYHIAEKESKGRNESSGDSISVWFKKGRASYLTLVGRARGVYVPEM